MRDPDCYRKSILAASIVNRHGACEVQQQGRRAIFRGCRRPSARFQTLELSEMSRHTVDVCSRSKGWIDSQCLGEIGIDSLRVAIFLAPTLASIQ